MISVLLNASLWYHYSSISSTINFPTCRLSSIHLPNIETHPWGPHPPLVPFHNLCPHRPSHISLGNPFLFLYTQPKLFFIYLVIVKILCFHHLLIFFIITLDGLIFPRKQNHVTIGWGIHSLFILTLFTNPNYPKSMYP
jgi:hypothetical protein